MSTKNSPLIQAMSAGCWPS